jgi:hypothetical protein
VSVSGADAADGEGAACDGKTDDTWGPLEGTFRYITHNGEVTKQIIVDFSSKGGPKDLTGIWNEHSKKIEWQDGNHWTMYGINLTGNYYDPLKIDCERLIKDNDDGSAEVSGDNPAGGESAT